MAVFYGVKCFDAFQVRLADGETVTRKNVTWPYWFHQFWFNFAGSLFGWAFLYFFLWHRMPLILSTNATFSDGFVLFVAFVGITGHLPYAVAGVLEGLKQIGLKLTGH